MILKHLVSSAKSNVVEVVYWGISFTYTRNNSGPNMEFLIRQVISQSIYFVF